MASPTSTNRTYLPSPELAADLNNLGSAALVISNALADLLENHSLPAACLPSMQASRRAAQSLITHLQSSQQLAELN
jgi:hypothetical protein